MAKDPLMNDLDYVLRKTRDAADRFATRRSHVAETADQQVYDRMIMIRMLELLEKLVPAIRAMERPLQEIGDVQLKLRMQNDASVEQSVLAASIHNIHSGGSQEPWVFSAEMAASLAREVEPLRELDRAANAVFELVDTVEDSW